jgi:hypothetical protein
LTYKPIKEERKRNRSLIQIVKDWIGRKLIKLGEWIAEGSVKDKDG